MILSYDRWTVEHVQWSKEKLLGIWGLLQRHPTLFSDLTRGDFTNFANSIIAQDTVLLEIKDGVVPVGYVKVMELYQEIDCDTHVVFFDRKPAEKTQLCKLITKWIFDNFPTLRRMSAEVPEIYGHTLRLAERIGFKREGVKRRAVCIGGKWYDLIQLGLLREESYGRS